MSLDIHADSFERPRIGRAAVPAFKVSARADFYTPKSGGSQKVSNDKPLSEKYQGGSDKLGDRAHLDLSNQDLTFDEFLDVINPLQHIPGIATLYREVTGDQISTAARSVGGFLYGGPLGLINGAVNGIVAEATGSDMAEHLLASISGPDEAIATAAAAPANLEANELSPRPPSLTKVTVAPKPDSLLPIEEEVSAALVDAEASTQANEGTLTGAPAIEAFLLDLQTIGVSRGEGAAPTVTSSPKDPATNFVPVNAPSQPEKQATAKNPPAEPQAAISEPADGDFQQIKPSLADGEGEAVASRMLEALGKYQTMLQRRHSQSSAGS